MKRSHLSDFVVAKIVISMIRHFMDLEELFTSLLKFRTRKYNEVVVEDPSFDEHSARAGVRQLYLMRREFIGRF
ncbi:MAG: hypothetical protein ACR2NZ_08795 [Rubripirellula sp.]